MSSTVEIESITKITPKYVFTRRPYCICFEQNITQEKMMEIVNVKIRYDGMRTSTSRHPNKKQKKDHITCDYEINAKLISNELVKMFIANITFHYCGIWNLWADFSDCQDFFKTMYLGKFVSRSFPTLKVNRFEPYDENDKEAADIISKLS